jgi:hypothetical protein
MEFLSAYSIYWLQSDDPFGLVLSTSKRIDRASRYVTVNSVLAITQSRSGGMVQKFTPSRRPSLSERKGDVATARVVSVSNLLSSFLNLFFYPCRGRSNCCSWSRDSKRKVVTIWISGVSVQSCGSIRLH